MRGLDVFGMRATPGRIIRVLAPLLLIGLSSYPAAGQSFHVVDGNSPHKAIGAPMKAAPASRSKHHKRNARKKSAPGARHAGDRNIAKRAGPSVAATVPQHPADQARNAATPERFEQDKTVAAARADAAPLRARSTDAELAAIAKIYCTNNDAGAAQARDARRREKLAQLEKEIEQRSSALATLMQDARNWVEKREKMLSATRDGLVETYSKMKPEAAAQQLAAMNDETATSIIMKLNARAASAILNEMGAERAARLADNALRRSSSAAPRPKSGT